MIKKKERKKKEEKEREKNRVGGEDGRKKEEVEGEGREGTRHRGVRGEDGK